MNPFQLERLTPDPGGFTRLDVDPGTYVSVVSGAQPGCYLHVADPYGAVDPRWSGFALAEIDTVPAPLDRVWIEWADTADAACVLTIATWDVAPPALRAPQARVVSSGESVSLPANTTLDLCSWQDDRPDTGQTQRVPMRRLEIAFEMSQTGTASQSPLRLVLEHEGGGTSVAYTQPFNRMQLDGTSSAKRATMLDLPIPSFRWKVQVKNASFSTAATVGYLVQTGT